VPAPSGGALGARVATWVPKALFGFGLVDVEESILCGLHHIVGLRRA
jgi:hypothetical protein